MASKITITPSTQYIEDPINIRLGGISNFNPNSLHIDVSVFSGERGQIAYYQEGIVSTNFNITCPEGTHQSPSGVNYGLEYIYSSDLWQNTSKLNTVFQLIKGDQVLAETTKTMYMKPDPPTFNRAPYYRVVNSSSNAFSGDDQMIVRGLSNITFGNITGTAKKHATLKYFRMNDKLVDYNAIINAPSGWFYPIEAIGGYTNLEVALIDSRGFEKVIQLADFTKFTYSYQIPKITEMTVERDIASETTTLSVKGYYSEGYQVNKNALTSGYEYAENVEGATTETGITSLTITKTPTSAFQDYLNILEEYNNPHYTSYSNFLYYDKTTFETDIQSLFETAISYNNKYTQEYLENDYNLVYGGPEGYYCASGGYRSNQQWRGFWADTLKEIYKEMYDNNVYGINIVGDEDGGNYEFEINASIQGDIVGGFSIDKTFYITNWILDSKNANTSDKRIERTEFLPTAIPAIDVYKDKVALHGLYDENISDSDIQLWGETFLNGYNLQNIVSATAYEGTLQIGKIGIEWGIVEVSPSTGSGTNYYGSARVDFENTYKYSPGFFANAAIGSTAINNISTLNPSRTYGNVWMSSTNNTARNCRYLVIGILEDNE